MSSDAYNKLKEEVIQLRQQLEAAEASLRKKDNIIYRLRSENRALQYELYFENQKRKNNDSNNHI